MQISDSHIGFDKPANPNALGTFQEAIAKIKAMPTQPAFIIHTGDISHLSKDKELDDADQVDQGAEKAGPFMPGEHDVADADNGKPYLERYGKNTQGKGWYSFDAGGVHFIALINVFEFRTGLQIRRPRQNRRRAARMDGEGCQRPLGEHADRGYRPPAIVDDLPGLGLGHRGRAARLGYLKRFGSVTVLNGHIHQIQQKVEGNVSFYTARSTAFPQPAPGTAPAPGPMKVPAEQLHSFLGVRTVNYVQGKSPLALIETPLGA